MMLQTNLTIYIEDTLDCDMWPTFAQERFSDATKSGRFCGPVLDPSWYYLHGPADMAF